MNRITPRRLSENREPTVEKLILARFSHNIDEIQSYISPLWGHFQWSKFAPGVFVVKYSKYSPQIMKKPDSKQLSLATASILGQPPRLLWACLTLVPLMLITVPGFATDTQNWDRSDESNPSAIDHQPWQKILDNYLQSDHPSGVNRFRYSQVSADDKNTLKTYLAQLQAIDPRTYRRSEQMAYWINLYNALTIDLILENYPVKSIKKIGKGFFSFGPWDDDIAYIAGNKLTLNDIEHKILRPLWKGPRIHYAVNCASYGCPNLASMAFTANNIDSLLNQSAHDYVNHP